MESLLFMMTITATMEFSVRAAKPSDFAIGDKMRLLGAILAGGAATRFGSDKGSGALIGGRALIDHVADALRPQVATLVVCGRHWPGLEGLADRPASGLGPLGGLCAALAHAGEWV